MTSLRGYGDVTKVKPAEISINAETMSVHVIGIPILYLCVFVTAGNHIILCSYDVINISEHFHDVIKGFMIITNKGSSPHKIVNINYVKWLRERHKRQGVLRCTSAGHLFYVTIKAIPRRLLYSRHTIKS